MRKRVSELMMRNPLSGLMMRKRRKRVSELMMRKRRKRVSELMMRNPLSELMRNPLSKDFIKMYHKIQFGGGGGGYFWQRALGLGAPCLGPTEKSCDRRQIYLYLNV